MAWLTVNADLVSFLPELVNTFGTLLLGPLSKSVPLTDIVEEGHAKTAGRQHQINIEIQDLPCPWKGWKQRHEILQPLDRG